MHYIVTGGYGFIGSRFIKLLKEREPDCNILNIDCLTYAADKNRVSDPHIHLNYSISDPELKNIIKEYAEHFQIQAIINFAAESHVDNSINNGSPFITTNINGTYNLLEIARELGIKFIQVSTDEVYGSIDRGSSTEEHTLNPSSVYSASKAAADLLVLSNYKTHKQDCIITRCSNNYGVNQHPEKLVPKTIINAIKGLDIPVYGNGSQIRDWIHVDDHCSGIYAAMKLGISGQIYNFGGPSNVYDEVSNLTLVKAILKEVNSTSYIINVEDRKGHDNRYAMNWLRSAYELGWHPTRHILDDIPELVREYRYRTN